MEKMSQKAAERKKRWFFVGLCVTCIYSTLYIVRPLCEYLRKATPLALLINVGMAVLILLILLVCFRRLRIRRASTFLLLGLVLALYGGAVYWLKIPEERIHIVEYGFLAFLVYRAVALDWRGPRCFLIAFILASLFGWGDEGIQYLLPNRVYQLKDVMLNSISSALGLLLTFVLTRESNVNSQV